MANKPPQLSGAIANVLRTNKSERNTGRVSVTYAFPSPCHDCGLDTIALGEYYWLRDAVWDRACRGEDLRFLCILCLERRLGRKVRAKDLLFDDADVAITNAVCLLTSVLMPKRVKLKTDLDIVELDMCEQQAEYEANRTRIATCD